MSIAAGTRSGAVLELLDPGRLAVVLVGDLADDLLDDVLDGDQPGGAAVLVDDDREVVLVALHLAQQVVDRLALGHEVHGPHHLGDGMPAGLGGGVEPAGDVLEVEQAAHVVAVLADDRDPREAGPQEQRHRLRSVLSASRTTMSVRGTMTSRATVSPSSKTEWIISRSLGLDDAESPAMSTRSRSSASVWNGPSR